MTIQASKLSHRLLIQPKNIAGELQNPNVTILGRETLDEADILELTCLWNGAAIPR